MLFWPYATAQLQEILEDGVPRDFVSLVHKSTKRGLCRPRVTEVDQGSSRRRRHQVRSGGAKNTGMATVCKGLYGGYKYDGRWRKVADAMVQQYGIVKPGMRILDGRFGQGLSCASGTILFFGSPVPARVSKWRALAEDLLSQYAAVGPF